MKKSKLLIPALSIASVGAVVTPMVTSCGSTKGLLSFDVIQNKAWNTNYTPMTAATAHEYHDAQEYAEGVVKTINSNPTIWADGMISSYIDFTQWYTEPTNTASTEDVTTRTLTVSNASIHNKTITMSESAKPTVTSMVSFDLVVVDKYSIKEGAKTTSYTETVTYNIKNMPYTFYQSTQVTPIGSSDPVTYNETVAVPALLYLNNSSRSDLQINPTGTVQAFLAFLESDFSIKFADKTVSTSGDITTDFDITIDDVATLELLFSGGQANPPLPILTRYFGPLVYPVQPNYLAKATHRDVIE